MKHSNTIYEQNVAAVCETWWWTGDISNRLRRLCQDGTPAGYAVFDVNNTNLTWYYKSIGLDKSRQFRSYDMNTVKAFFSQQAVIDRVARLSGRSNDYASVAANVVYINIFDYDTDWQIEVKEGSTTLAVTRLNERDPLHVYAYEYAASNPSTSYQTNVNRHIFKVTAASATSALTIKITDRFGNVYTETMTRPKAFDNAHVDM
jgi:hypothetical protein